MENDLIIFEGHVKVIGVGAAGNKAAIHLVETQVISPNDMVLINSTIDDVPEKYVGRTLELRSATGGGCGKERNLAKNLCLESFQNGTLSKLSTLFSDSMDPSKDICIIVNSSEGGTGCGASTILANYFSSIIKTNVHMFVFTGFEDDGRGLQNTVEYFKELNEKYVVQVISNKKCLTGYNRKAAEEVANEEFARRVHIMLGNKRRKSDQNIDNTDLLKSITLPGYMNIEFIPLNKIKNIEAFNKAIIDAIDNTKSLDVKNPCMKRLALYFNVNPETRDVIDIAGTAIQNKYGVTWEIFQHIQETTDGDSSEWCAFVASGMRLPIDEVKEIYDKYNKRSSMVNKEKDSFFATIGTLTSDNSNNIFDLDTSSSQNVDNGDVNTFLSLYGMEAPTGGFGKVMVHAKAEEKQSKSQPEKTESGDIKV